MILCVTLNPCLDKTLVVPPWQPGDSVRGQAVTEVVGGKGNNVARVLSRLGRTARPATFLGGSVGVRCETLLRDADGLDPLVVATQAPTRVILTVRTVATNAQSAFFDPDPEITPGEADALMRVVERAIASEEVKALTLSGSSPSESTHGLYLDLISVARGKAIPVFLDTYGPALKSIWGVWPDYLQLNLREAGMFLGLPKPSEGDVLALLRDWSRRGVRMAVVSAGPEQVLAQVEGKLYRIAPPAIEPVNPIGSGDSLLGGVVDAWLSGSYPETILRRAVACAVANALVWDAGGIDPAKVDRLEAELEVEEIGGGGFSGPPVGWKGNA
jgi:1-phosphofructokinase family hexose kinase